MEKLIDITSDQVAPYLDLLLKDKSSKRNIIWATDTYDSYGSGFNDKEEITKIMLLYHPDIIKPRIQKSLEDQQARTRKKAEVFTPVWLCNQMNNYCDEEWFGRKNIFNTENKDHSWIVAEDKIVFPKDKNWKQYVDSRRLEITCGEAPYLVSRYDVSSGEMILPPKRRIGQLDRKLRIVNENAKDYDEWVTWTIRAFEASYGYEYQGDNLLIARINLLLTFFDYYRDRWEKEPDEKLLLTIVNKIVWNIWQMDGLKDTVPLGKPYEEFHQMTLFDMFLEESEQTKEEAEAVPCKAFNWRSNNSITFKKLKGDVNVGKKLFDFVIGNPPYQDSESVNNRSGAVYPIFYDVASELASKYMLISPARFLFNSGLTSKEWNKKMLSDPNLKVLRYEEDARNVFPNTDIKGGVAIMYRDKDKNFGAIGEFIPNEKLRSIAAKFKKDVNNNLPSIIYGGRSDLKFTDEFLNDFPQSINDRLKVIQKKHPNVTRLSPNEEYELKSSTFEVLPYAFCDSPPLEESYEILGLASGKRIKKWILKKYMTPRYPNNNNIDKFKVFVPESNGTGKLNLDVLSTPVVARPYESCTPTFISIGNFNTEEEAANLLKYIKTKFCRVLLGIMKKTQHNSAPIWAYVPLQDFTPPNPTSTGQNPSMKLIFSSTRSMA